MPFQLPLCLRNSFMIVAFLIATICAASTWARDGLAPDVLQRVKAATVLVKVSTEGVQKRGTGFFISKDTVVTNAHVLGISSQNNHTPERIEVILDGDAPNSSAHRASLLDIDVESDLAFLQMSDPRKPEFINIRSSPVAAENLKVFALEYSDGDLPNTEQSSRLIKFSSAVVVQLDNSKQVKRIRFQGSVIPSSDGGPVVDTDGNLIAILTKSIVETRLGLTIAAEVLQSCLRGRIKNVSVTPTLLNGTRYSINISVRTIDPLQNIEAAGFYTWNVPKSAVPPTDLLDGFAKFGDQNGSPRAENKLDLDRMNRRADGVLQRFDLKPAVDLWVQPFVRDTSGERAAEAVNVSAALRKRIETEARLREEEQRIAESARRFPRMPPLPKPKAIPVEERRRDGGYLNQTLSPKISSELESRFAKPATANKVVPVAADLTKDIPAILERDASGQPITVLYSAAEIRKLDSPPILQMAVRSDGSELYVVFERKSTVSIFDPKSMSLIGEISVPRQPVSLWCDQNFLVVACRESHLVAFIDLQTRKLVKSVRIPPGEYDLPVQIVGPAPDGSMITICASSDVQNTLRTLFLIDHTGDSFEVIRGQVDWCAFGDKGSSLFAQSGFGNSAWCNSMIYMSSRIGPKAGPILEIDSFGIPGLGAHSACGRAFQTSDSSKFILPIYINDDRTVGRTTTVQTLVLRPDLEEVLFQIPGNVVAEYAAQDCYISWNVWPLADNFAGKSEVIFASASTGRPVRRVKLTKDSDLSGQPLLAQSVRPNSVFVPGHECLIFYDPRATLGEVKIVRCGPVEPAVFVPADPKHFEDNMPPKKAIVGRKITYTPNYIRPKDLKKLVYQVKKGVAGMTINAETGAISFTPRVANIGLHDIEIVGQLDGVEVPIVAWTLEIDRR